MYRLWILVRDFIASLFVCLVDPGALMTMYVAGEGGKEGEENVLQQ